MWNITSENMLLIGRYSTLQHKWVVSTKRWQNSVLRISRAIRQQIPHRKSQIVRLNPSETNTSDLFVITIFTIHLQRAIYKAPIFHVLRRPQTFIHTYCNSKMNLLILWLENRKLTNHRDVSNLYLRLTFSLGATNKTIIIITNPDQSEK